VHPVPQLPLPRLVLAALGLSVGFAASLPLQHRGSAPATRSEPAAASTAGVHSHPHRTASVASSAAVRDPVRDALAASRVVVLAFFLPQSSLDATAVAEARVGARAAHAVFVPVDAMGEAGSALMRRYAVTTTPTLLVLTAPERVAFRATTFVDAPSMAQAVADARK
jgi:hypothetical protein